MKLENQVCSLEQAKKLKELGVKGAEFFLWLEVARFDKKGDIVEWLPALFIERSLDPECVSMLPVGCVNDDNEIMESRGNYPAFTVAELGVMLPLAKSEKSKQTQCWKTHDKYGWAMYEDGYIQSGFTVRFEPTEAQARAAMLIYLLENNHITAEEVNQRLTQ